MDPDLFRFLRPLGVQRRRKQSHDPDHLASACFQIGVNPTRMDQLLLEVETLIVREEFDALVDRLAGGEIIPDDKLTEQLNALHATRGHLQMAVLRREEFPTRRRGEVNSVFVADRR